MILCIVSAIDLPSQINPECEAIGITAPLGFTTELVPAQIMPGESFCVQFKAENFQSVIAYQHTFTFDPTELCFSTFFPESGALPSPLNANITQVQAGILTFVWFNLNAEGVSVPDNTILFTICFDACGEPSDCYEIGFNEVLQEFPSTEVNYQVGTEACTSNEITIDGASSTCIPIECADLSIIDLAICNSDNNMGSINFNICGGEAPYFYEVSTATTNVVVKSGTIIDEFGTFSGTLDNLPAMNFIITVTDANNVTVSMPAIIDAIPSVSFDPIITTDPICAETSNGEVSISNVSNAFGELFDIAFSNGISLQDVNEATFSQLSNGDYFITITEGSGCETVEMVTLDTPPLELDIQTTAASCLGSGDGFLSVQVSGGTPFTDGYLINNIPGQTSLETTTPFLDNAFNGITNRYRVRVEDANGCRLDEDIMIPILSDIEVDFFELDDVNCKNACDGSIKILASSPGGNFVYRAADEDGEFVSGGVLNDTFIVTNVLCAGMYSVRINDLTTGCEKDTFFTINEPAEELIVSFAEAMASCSGNDGEVEITTIGGMDPYLYLWEDQPSNNSNTLTGVGEGIYNVTITDDLGCMIDTFVSVVSDNVLEIEAFIAQNLACDGTGTGLLDVTILNSTSMQTPVFEWTDINGSLIGGNQTQTFVNPGDYIINVTTIDNNCTVSDTINIPFEFGLMLEIETTNPSCESGNNGEINIVNIEGGEPPYTCIWEDPVTTVSSCNAVDLAFGTYNVMVVDNNGCQKDTFVTLTAEQVEFTFDINPRSVSCPGASDGSVNIENISGGTGPYSCVWQDPIFTCNPTGLAPGLYNFAIIDNNNCSKDTFVEIFEPTQNITFDLNIINPSCGGDLGSIFITNLDGANFPFTQMWSDSNLSGLGGGDLSAGEYTVTISDARMCQIDTTITLITTSDDLIVTIDATPPDCAVGLDNGTISFPGFSGTCEWEDASLNPQNCTLIGLGSGIYNVTLTDDMGCQKDTFIDLTVTDALQASVSNIMDASCFEGDDGQAFVEVTDDPLNVGVYNFFWSSTADNETGVATSSATQLGAGENFVIVSDGTCSTDTLKFDIGAPDEVMLDLNNTVISNTICNGACNGSVNLAAMGGTSTTGTYGYLWEDGSTDDFRDDLCAGEYSITIIDDNSCESISLIQIAEPDTLIVMLDTINIVQLDCKGEDNASFTVLAEGGCGGFTYQWTDDVSTTSTGSNLGAGIYNVTVTDACGCSSEISYEFATVQELVAVPLAFDDPLCPGDKVCIGIESASGGTNTNFTYSINISPGIPIDSCVMVNPGQYDLAVFDSAGCSTQISVEVANPDPIVVDLGDDIVFEIGQESAEISADVTGGTPEYSFNWITETDFTCLGDSCQDISITPTSFSIFEVIVTDANGCTSKDDIFVDVKAARNVYFPNVFNPDDLPPNDKFIPLTGVGVEELVVFRIFDRWGNLVFERENLQAPTNIDDGWDGRKGNGANSRLVPGVYVYTAVVRFIDDVQLTFSGEVTLLR